MLDPVGSQEYLLNMRLKHPDTQIECGPPPSDLETIDLNPTRDSGKGLCANIKFLSVEKTACILFLIIQTFVFIVPLFSAVLLLIENVKIFHDVESKTNDPHPHNLTAFLNIVVLVTICLMSFVELFALKSRLLTAFVSTEALMWTGYLVGSTTFGDEDNGVKFWGALSNMVNVPSFLMTFSIVFKFLLIFWLAVANDKEMRFKPFFKYKGKNI